MQKEEDIYKYEDFKTKEGKIKLAKRYKDEGNDFFKKGELEKAMSKYSRVFAFTKGLITNENESFSSIKQIIPREPKFEITKEEEKEIRELSSITYSNMAEIQLRKGEWGRAKEKANLSLKENPNNGKAYYRRGRALIKMNDFEEAIADLKRGKYILPEMGGAFDTEISIAKQELKKYNEKERKRMKGFLDKMGEEEEELNLGENHKIEDKDNISEIPETPEEMKDN